MLIDLAHNLKSATIGAVVMITQDYLKSLVRYDPATGDFFWLDDRPQSHFRTVHGYRIWKTQCSGKKAGSRCGSGYQAIGINGTKIRSHRLAWLYMTGSWPSCEIDHINGIKTDNKWGNIRDVNRIENARNLRLPSANKSGIIGVHFNKNVNKWVAQIRVNGRTLHLGCFASIEDAAKARSEASRKYGFHKNHGKNFENTTNINWHLSPGQAAVYGGTHER